MTVTLMIGRRVPRSWFRKGIQKAAGILSFQEHIWQIVKQSLNLSKKKANSSNTGVKIVITTDKEYEDMNYEIHWVKCIIQGNREQEQEEYRDCNQLYQQFGKVLKGNIPVADERLKQHFKTKILTNEQVSNAYIRGFGSVSDNNIANKLLEMGILTHLDYVDDYDQRSPI